MSRNTAQGSGSRRNQQRFALRHLAVIACFVVLASALSAKEDSLEELKARFDKAHKDDRVELGIKIAQRQLQNADNLYRDGNVGAARAAVDDVVNFSQQASDAAVQTKKRLKNTEIDVRRMAEKFRDIKRTLAFEDQAAVDTAIRQLEDLRTALLSAMFAKDGKKP
jgi:hypothetical protein